MPFPPEDLSCNICPCCGIEFGYDDFYFTHAELRESWVNKGAKWFSEFTPAPLGWNAQEQLKGGRADESSA